MNGSSNGPPCFGRRPKRRRWCRSQFARRALLPDPEGPVTTSGGEGSDICDVVSERRDENFGYRCTVHPCMQLGFNLDRFADPLSEHKPVASSVAVVAFLDYLSKKDAARFATGARPVEAWWVRCMSTCTAILIKCLAGIRIPYNRTVQCASKLCQNLPQQVTVCMA